MMNKDKQTPHPSVFWVKLICLICIGLGGLFFYQHTATYTARAYVRALKTGDYEKAYSYYLTEKNVMAYNKNEVLAYLERTTAQKGKKMALTALKNISSQSDLPEQYFAIVYNNTDVEALRLCKVGYKWYVVFPFASNEVTVIAPLGTTVTVGNKTLTCENGETYKLKNVLPGQYVVRLIYKDGTYPAYETWLDVPNKVQVISPYETVTVQIMTNNFATVTLDNEKLEISEGVATCNNLLPGNYILRIEDEDNFFAPYEAKVEVGEQGLKIEKQLTELSEEGEKSLVQYLNQFYTTYKSGILKGDATQLVNFFAHADSQEKIEEYEAWFVDAKTITDVSLKVEKGQIHINEEGNLLVPLLEKVYLTNLEKLEEEETEINYQLILNWETILKRDGHLYTIVDRTLTESVIAYQDEEGDWVQY